MSEEIKQRALNLIKVDEEYIHKLEAESKEQEALIGELVEALEHSHNSLQHEFVGDVKGCYTCNLIAKARARIGDKEQGK